MASCRKLSERGKLVVPVEPPDGLPDYLRQPILDWIVERFRRGGPDVEPDLLRQAQLDLPLSPPLTHAVPETSDDGAQYVYSSSLGDWSRLDDEVFG